MIKFCVFVDPRVSDFADLLAGYASDAQVVVLDLLQDGVMQIAEALTGQSGIDAIHIVSHGAVGSLSLGGSVLNSITLPQYSGALATIGAALNSDGDILLYGCDVAQGAAGQRFIQQLAAYTQADVVASIPALRRALSPTLTTPLRGLSSSAARLLRDKLSPPATPWLTRMVWARSATNGVLQA